MFNDQYHFILMGNTAPYEPYFSNEIRKSGALWLAPESDLPCSDPAIISAFLSVRRPSAVFYAPYLSSTRAKNNARVVQAAAHALENTDSLLVTWEPAHEDYRTDPDCNILTLKLPEHFVCSNSANIVTAGIQKLLEKKRLTIKEDHWTELIGRHLLTTITVKSALAALANPELCGKYAVSANGIPTEFELLSFIREFLTHMLPETSLAKIHRSAENQSAQPEPSNLVFQETFGMILPKWQDCVKETSVAYLAAHGLI